MRLEVKKTKRRSTKSTERAFEHRFAAALGNAGRVSYHTTEEYIAGIPDRYVVSGTWIEFKAIAYKNSVSPLRFLSPAQKVWLTRLEDAGDTCYICILFQPENGEKRFMLMEWCIAKQLNKMSALEIFNNTSPMSDLNEIARHL